MTIPSTTSVDPATCRHEYVRIYQRRLKGLERRLVATKAYLPVGFKVTDFTHLGEGSYCFCSRCRMRLFPKRTAGEKAAAKAALAAEKAAAAAGFISGAGAIGADDDGAIDALDATDATDATDTADDTSEKGVPDIHVEELEIESTELEDLEQGSVAVEDDIADDISET